MIAVWTTPAAQVVDTSRARSGRLAPILRLIPPHRGSGASGTQPLREAPSPARSGSMKEDFTGAFGSQVRVSQRQHSVTGSPVGVVRDRS